MGQLQQSLFCEPLGMYCLSSFCPPNGIKSKNNALNVFTVLAFENVTSIKPLHGEMNRFLMTKTTREMRVVPAYGPNIPLKGL